MTPLRPTPLRRPAAAVCLVVATLAVTGCVARRTPSIRYYRVSVPPPAAATIGATIVVSSIGAEPGYAETRMAWRPSPYRIEYTAFHRWVAAPSLMLSSVLEEHLTQAATGTPSRRVFVTGTVRRIEAVRTDDGRDAVLGLTLAAELDGHRLVERTWDEREPVADSDDPEAVAAAISAALTRILAEFTAALAAHVPAS